jgi:hypothetical protein
MTASRQSPPCRTVELHINGEVGTLNSDRHGQALRAWKECWSECQPGEAMLLDLADAHLSAPSRAMLAAFVTEAAAEGHTVILRNAPAPLEAELATARRLPDGSLAVEGQ